MKNHRKPWTLAEETAFAEFMIASIRRGNTVKSALAEASVQFERRCEDRWNRYGLINLYASDLEEAKRISLGKRYTITPR